MKENKSKYAIMGMLSMGPVSGYDIKKRFEKSLSYFWSESYGQIYPILKKLAKQGLQDWMVQPVDRQIGRHEILLKLFFGQHVSPADNIRQVEHFRKLQSKNLEEIKATKKVLNADYKDNPALPYWLITVKYGLQVNRAYLRWCKETLAVLKRMEQETE